MAKNLAVIDTKPKNSQVIDTKPKNSNTAVDFGTEQLYSVTIKAGQSMGLLLALTYKTAFTVITNKSP